MSNKKFLRGLNFLVYTIVILSIAVFFIPAKTKQSVDSALVVKSIPLGFKIVEFLDRDYHYRELVKEIVKECRTDEEKVRAVFEWTCKNIRTDYPNGWTLVDDHIWNSVVRGYGNQSASAEVFTTLSTYAGCPAAAYRAQAEGSTKKIVLSVARINGRFYLFDSARCNIFLKQDGSLATLDDIIEDPSIAARAVNRPVIRGVNYEDYFKRLKKVERFRTIRPELQMPLGRLKFELLRLAGFIKVKDSEKSSVEDDSLLKEGLCEN